MVRDAQRCDGGARRNYYVRWSRWRHGGVISDVILTSSSTLRQSPLRCPPTYSVSWLSIRSRFRLLPYFWDRRIEPHLCKQQTHVAHNINSVVFRPPFTLEIIFEINFEIYVNQFFSQENFLCEQSTFQRNTFLYCISRFRTCSSLQNYTEEISLMEHCDWSIGQCLQTSNEASTMLAFKSLFPMWKCLL